MKSVLARLGLADHATLLASYAALEIGLVPDETVAVAVGSTRIGGAPDLPADMPWPCRRWLLAETLGWPDYAQAEIDVTRGRGQAWVEGDELVMPIPFIMQVDLGRIDPVDKRLPDRGVLAFFASVTSDIPDPAYAKRVAAAVCYFDGSAALAPRPHPPTVDAPPTIVVPLRAESAIRWTIPYEDIAVLEAALPPAAYAALVADARRDRHALLPAPAVESWGPMPPHGEIGLMRVHDDYASGFGVGDASWITFVINELDLRARRFADARASVFCG